MRCGECGRGLTSPVRLHGPIVDSSRGAVKPAVLRLRPDPRDGYSR